MTTALFLILCLEFLGDQYWACYADDNTPYTISFNSDAVKKKFELNKASLVIQRERHGSKC